MFLKRLKSLPGALLDFIHLTARLADAKGIPAYIVGGFVRDSLLGVDNFDIDFVFEGDAIDFSSEVSLKLGLRALTHKRFGTATLRGPLGFKVDMATARKESYPKPAALPVVCAGHIRDDLFRRDFSINAMAVRLNKNHFGELVDFYGGLGDLGAGVLRALHPLSFSDDPTRILRAARFAQRLGFKIEAHTAAWIRQAAAGGMLERVQKHRLRDELVLIFKEDSPLPVIKRLYRFCDFSYLAPGLKIEDDWEGAFRAARQAIRWFKESFSHRHLDAYIMYLCLFFYPLAREALGEVLAAFAFHKQESLRVLSFKENFTRAGKVLSQKDLAPSEVWRLFEPLSYEVILLIMALSASPYARKYIEDYLFFYHGQRLSVRGEDLAALGIEPGPRYKKILDELLYAKIDGRVKTRDEELELAKKLAEE